ncbi:MAG: MBL fold metallo-hydrolase [Candidatus Babeliales bacterium]|jgi:glyoxylase-like metal-dependent hydrolase (beta-lactamase superfamily II)
MSELIHLSGRTWYIKSPTNIGLFVTDNNEVILIDSGNDKDAARKVLSILQSNNWTLKMIINTHSNADHVGGNSYLQEKTNCRIAATRFEAAFISDPVLESSFLFGAYPNSKMRNKFLLSQPSNVTDIISYDCENALIVDTTLRAVPLPGHFMDMIGVMTPDKVFFAGDSLFSSNVLNKYHITFLYDVKSFIQTLDKLEQMHACLFIPSHADSTDDIKQLVKINKNKINEVTDTILEYCVDPINFENLLKKLFDHYGLILDFNQYILVGSTVKSYLSYLYDLKQIEAIFENNVLLWKKI